MAKMPHKTKHAKLVKSGSGGRRSASYSSDLPFARQADLRMPKRFRRTVLRGGNALAYELAYGPAYGRSGQ